jgi:hypothetical protein
VLIFVFAITSVASTYLIGYSHPLQARLSRWLSGAGLRDLGEDAAPPGGAAASGDTPARPQDVVLLGFFTQASALIHEYELAAAGRAHPMLERLLVIDFNPVVHAELHRRGIACRYGDVSNMQTLHHAEVHDARLVVSTIPDSILKGTDNARLLRQARSLWPHARVVVTAARAAGALALYEDGADFVYVPSLHSAAQLAAVLEQGVAEGFEALRAAEIERLRQRDEVIK